MKTFWRLKRKDTLSIAYELKKIFPELKNRYSEDIEEQLRFSDIEFYHTEKVTTHPWIRLTLPLFFIVTIVLFVFMPIHYMITGYWGYRYEPLKNWLRALSL